MDGISDLDDDLKFDMVISNGPEEYINWFGELTSRILKDKQIYQNLRSRRKKAYNYS